LTEVKVDALDQVGSLVQLHADMKRLFKHCSGLHRVGGCLRPPALCAPRNLILTSCPVKILNALLAFASMLLVVIR
jgi:hypothetical protein